MESVQVCLEVFLVGFAISLGIATMIKGLLVLINHAENRMKRSKA